MNFLKNTIHFLLFFLVIETIAMTAVVFSFYESLQNALKQESILSDHRSRDLILALAKSSELRLQKEGFVELDKLFNRYIEKTNSDPEQFKIIDISLYSKEALLLVSTKPEYTNGLNTPKSPDTKLFNSDFFKKGIRMKKWEWTSPEEAENQVSLVKPDIHASLEWVLKYLPLAQKNTVRISTPLYNADSLDVTGLVILTYERGNMSLLFLNQLKLIEWMVINYSFISLIISLFLTAIFFLFQVLYESKGNHSTMNPKLSEDELPILEVKTLHSVVPSAEHVGGEPSSEESEIQIVSVVPLQDETNQSKIFDAIYLG
ncbi:MAG: hypothetical protein O9301_09500 [Leptospira sp.]|nr:hypothetical protein [Leptospira sp.]